jgi:hypothetical protein
MNIRIGKAISQFALCLIVPMAVLHAQAGTKVDVTCNDGTTSPSVGKGACSGHGGVTSKTTTKTTAAKKSTAAKTKASTKTAAGETKATKSTKTKKASTKAESKVATKPAAPAAKPSAMASAADKDPKDATASCKDGTYSHAATHSGACSGHGGVLKFLKP